MFVKNKYRMYIDEVGSETMKNLDNFDNRYLSLTGIIVNIDYMTKVVAPVMEGWKSKYFPNNKNDSPVIFHRKEMRRKYGTFYSLMDDNIKTAFSNDFLNSLSNWDYKVVTILIDKKEHSEKYSVWQYEPYHFCFKVLLERYYYFLSNKKAIGDVMIEARGEKTDKKLNESYKRIYNGSDDTTSSINFVKGEDFQKVFTSNELKVKRKSANDLGLQLADLVAYPSQRYVFELFDIDIKQKRMFDNSVIEILKTKYCTTSKGEIIGAGIKFLPKKNLLNLIVK